LESADKIGDTSQLQDGRQYREQIVMTGNKALVVIGITTALGVLNNDSAAAKGRGSGHSGAVLPCSLDGINPVYHPDIFDNPAAARSYGFVKGQDGVWRVQPGCRR
jgi:hypothetical protein